MTAVHGARLLRFGVFELDLDAGALRRRGRYVRLPPQAFAVLVALASRRGEVVTRDELRALLWPDGVHVDHERGLNHCLNRIRRVLGDDAHAPRFVETLPRRGYRFLAEVTADDVGSVTAPEAIGAPPTEVQPVVATRSGPAPRLALVAAVLVALASAGSGRLVSPPREPSAPALAAYAEGMRLLEQGPVGWRRSIEPLREAARLDPRFAPPRHGLADAYMRLGERGVLPARQAFPAARHAAETALALEERADTLLILAAVRLNYEWDWAAAESAYRRALRLEPDRLGTRLAYARLLSAAGRHDEALRLLGETETRHPGCPEIVRDMGWAHYRARHFDEAARHFRDWAGLEPALRDPHHWLALLHHLRGQDEAAVREARLVYKLAGARPAYVARFEKLAPPEAMVFYLRGSLGYLEGLQPEQWITADVFAPLRALLGDRERALRDLERAADERSPRLVTYLRDPAFDALRHEERFLALQQRLRDPAAAPARPAAVTIAAAIPLG